MNKTFSTTETLKTNLSLSVLDILKQRQTTGGKCADRMKTVTSSVCLT